MPRLTSIIMLHLSKLIMHGEKAFNISSFNVQRRIFWMKIIFLKIARCF